METDLYIGPLIERSGKFSYDTFSMTEGLRRSFRYPRVEEARYDRRTLLVETGSDARARIRVCETVEEFERMVAQARGKTPEDGEPSER
jgi:hypothetical protein